MNKRIKKKHDFDTNFQTNFKKTTSRKEYHSIMAGYKEYKNQYNKFYKQKLLKQILRKDIYLSKYGNDE